VTARLERLDVEVTLVPITTAGDRQQQPIGATTAPGLFTKEIQRALLEDRIDLAVHSLKDLPTDPVEGLHLAAVPERAAVADVLVLRERGSWDDLAEGAAVGTGSLRRRAQLLHERPDLVMKDIRGNVDTRLRKLDQGLYDALLLAEAGLRRLGLEERISQTLPLALVLPAVGQGALGLETRSDDHNVLEVLSPLDHGPSHRAVLAERAMLSALEGGCLAPVAAWGRADDDSLKLTGRVLSPDGRQKIEVTQAGPPDQPLQLGRQVAEALIAQGAPELIRLARETG
jgi:hydroxymethylbilane synthase